MFTFFICWDSFFNSLLKFVAIDHNCKLFEIYVIVSITEITTVQ